MAEPTSYQGGSFFLRWWPTSLLALALGVAVMSELRAIQWITLLVVIAFVHVRFMPWQFTIREPGRESLLRTAFTGLGYEVRPS